MPYQSKIWALNQWILIHKETFEDVTPEELYSNPAASRTRNPQAKKISLLITKNNSNNENKICIDLTLDEDEKPVTRHFKRKIIRREIKNKKRKYYLEDEANKSKLKNTAGNTKKEMNSFKLSSKKVHRSKNELKKKSDNQRYKFRKEEGQCFLYALRAVAIGISFDLYGNIFQDLNFNSQIELANELLGSRTDEKLVYGGKFIGSLKQVKENNGGRFICAFLHNNQLHCEGISNHSYSQDITNDIIATEDEERSFSLYFVKKVVR